MHACATGLEISFIIGGVCVWRGGALCATLMKVSKIVCICACVRAYAYLYLIGISSSVGACARSDLNSLALDPP